MINRRIAYKSKRKLEFAPDFGEPVSMLTELTDSLSMEYCSNPETYKNDKDRVIWLEYPYFCFDCDTFFEEYGILLACIEKEIHVKVYGMADRLELGELTAEFMDEKNIRYCKKNSSGSNFESIRSLCIEIEAKSTEQYEALWELFSQMDYRYDYAAVNRKKWKAMGGDWTEKDPDTYFAYLQLREEQGGFFLNILTLEQKKELWTVYLEEGISPVEFEYLNDAIGREWEINIFEWNLALQMAMSQAGISVLYEKDDFRIQDRQGRRIWMDYRSSAAAEKLFLKLLFPAVPRTN